MLYIRSFSFYLVYVVSAVLAGLFGCLVGPFLNLKPRIKMLSVWPRFSNWILCKTCCIRINIEGKENIPEGPFVIVSNHQGQWETFFYQYLFFPLTTLLKRELLFIPFWGWALALLGPIAINRGNPRAALKKVFVEGENKIKKGFLILFFPEGTRKNPGEIGRYARSGFELAKKTNVPVLPLVHNSGDCWPAHRFLKFPGLITLLIGTPLSITDSSAQRSKEVEEWARKKLTGISNQN